MSDYPIVQQATQKGISPEKLVLETVQRLGNINKAAKALGCNQSTVRRWLLVAGYVYVPPPQRGTLKKVTIEE